VKQYVSDNPAVTEEYHNGSDTEQRFSQRHLNIKEKMSHCQSGVDLHVPKRKIKGIEIEHYPQNQTISIWGSWKVRQNMGMQKRISRTSHTGCIACSGVSAVSPHQVAAGPLMPLRCL